MDIKLIPTDVLDYGNAHYLALASALTYDTDDVELELRPNFERLNALSHCVRRRVHSLTSAPTAEINSVYGRILRVASRAVECFPSRLAFSSDG